jgi:hypothetical protein
LEEGTLNWTERLLQLGLLPGEFLHDLQPSASGKAKAHQHDDAGAVFVTSKSTDPIQQALGTDEGFCEALVNLADWKRGNPLDLARTGRRKRRIPRG